MTTDGQTGGAGQPQEVPIPQINREIRYFGVLTAVRDAAGGFRELVMIEPATATAHIFKLDPTAATATARGLSSIPTATPQDLAGLGPAPGEKT